MSDASSSGQAPGAPAVLSAAAEQQATLAATLGPAMVITAAAAGAGIGAWALVMVTARFRSPELDEHAQSVVRHVGEVMAVVAGVLAAGIAAALLVARRMRAAALEGVIARSVLGEVVTSSDDAIVTKSLEGRITSWNKAAERMFGHTAQEAIGQPITIIIPEERLTEETTILGKIRRGERVDHYETIRITKDRTRKMISLTVSPVRDHHGRIIGASKVARDIGAQKAAARARPLLAAIVESADDAIISKTLDGIITSWNRGAERMFGYTPPEVVGRSITILIPPDQLDEETGILTQVRRGERVDHFETVRMTKTGERIKVSLTVSPVRNEDGEIIGASKIARDISERERAAQRLRESDERFRLALSSGAIIVYEQDENLRYRWVHPVDASLPDSPIGHTDEELLPAGQGSELTAIKRGVLASGEPVRREVHVSIPGGKRWYDLLVEPRRDEKGRMIGVGGVALDITVRREAQEALKLHQAALEGIIEARTRELDRSQAQLRGAERLASLGTLSAGLGHDMGNLILPVRMRLDALERNDLPDRAKEDVEAIRASVTYLQRLSNSLKLFAADPAQRSGVEVTALEDWWTDTQPLMRTSLPRGVELREQFEPAGAGLRVKMGPHQLTQAIFNLVQNAGEALKEARTPQGWVQVSWVDSREGRVKVSVSDNGPGMTPEVLRRCTEPFFSTKVRRISTGMGLSLVRGLVEGIGGTLVVESELGAGSRFILDLPGAPRPATSGVETETQKLRAAVTIQDERTRAYTLFTLRSLGLDAQVTTPEPDPQTLHVSHLWVVESRADMMEAARRFIEGGTGKPGDGGSAMRRVVVYGAGPAEVDVDAGGGSGPIFYVAKGTGPGQVRTILERAVRGSKE